MKKPSMYLDFALQLLLKFAMSNTLLFNSLTRKPFPRFFLNHLIAFGKTTLTKSIFTLPKTLCLRYR